MYFFVAEHLTNFVEIKYLCNEESFGVLKNLLWRKWIPVYNLTRDAHRC